MMGPACRWAGGEIIWTCLGRRPEPALPVGRRRALPGLLSRQLRVALLLVARSRTDSFRSSLWLDGAIARSPVAALIATLAFQPIVDATSGGPAEIAVNLAYPVGDLLLLGLVVAVFGLNGWRPDPVWLLLGGGLALTAVADGLYLVQTAEGHLRRGHAARRRLARLGAAGGPRGLAAGAQETPRPDPDWLIMAVPVGCGLVAVQLLVYDHFERVNAGAVSLPRGRCCSRSRAWRSRSSRTSARWRRPTRGAAPTRSPACATGAA